MSGVVISTDGSIRQVGINRPEHANALGSRTIRQIGSVLDSIETRESEADREATTRTTGMLLTGDPERFSAGADLSELNGTIEDLGFDDELEALCRRLTLSPVPVVAAVEGACYGAAVDLAWSCDAVVISEEARLALPSAGLGILYNPSSLARLHARLGSPTLRRLIVLQQELSGRQLPPGAAMVVRPGTTVEAGKGLLRARAFATAATAATKALLASLDSGEEFDAAVWQPEREALVASRARRAALEAHRAGIGKDRSGCA